jgi:hypothetical protein
MAVKMLEPKEALDKVLLQVLHYKPRKTSKLKKKKAPTKPSDERK